VEVKSKILDDLPTDPCRFFLEQGTRSVLQMARNHWTIGIKLTTDFAIKLEKLGTEAYDSAQIMTVLESKLIVSQGQKAKLHSLREKLNGWKPARGGMIMLSLGDSRQARNCNAHPHAGYGPKQWRWFKMDWNYRRCVKKLKTTGSRVFGSDTDTEVIPT